MPLSDVAVIATAVSAIVTQLVWLRRHRMNLDFYREVSQNPATDPDVLRTAGEVVNPRGSSRLGRRRPRRKVAADAKATGRPTLQSVTEPPEHTSA